MPCRTQIRMMWWVRAAVRSWERPGSAGEIHRRLANESPELALADGIGDDLDVHAVPSVLGRVVRPAVADAVAIGEGSVQQDELRIVLAQRLEQARRAVGEQTGHGRDVGMGGPDGYPEASRDPGEGVVASQVHRATSARRCGGSLHRRSPSRVTMSIVTHSTRAWGRSSAAGWGTNEAPVPMG